MTADEWAACADWRELLDALPEPQATGRRLRLWVAGAADRRTGPDTHPWTVQAIELVLRACDEQHGWHEMQQARLLAQSAGRLARYADPVDYAVELIARFEYVPAVVYQTMAAAADALERVEPDLTRLFRCVFACPFRPTRVAPAWRTTAAVGLARTMYESRRFDRMPILADALEEAGCEVPEVLAHCRDADGDHVRGCWVVDGVLGKS